MKKKIMKIGLIIVALMFVLAGTSLAGERNKRGQRQNQYRQDGHGQKFQGHNQHSKNSRYRERDRRHYTPRHHYKPSHRRYQKYGHSPRRAWRHHIKKHHRPAYRHYRRHYDRYSETDTEYSSNSVQVALSISNPEFGFEIAAKREQ